MKKYLTMALALVLVATLSVVGTVAYLSDSADVANTMELGNVEIEQLEYERVTDDNGNWVPTTITDKYSYTPDKIQAFTQDKPLFPAVFADGKIKWDDRNGSENASGAGSHQQSWGDQIDDASGSNQLFDDSVKNVIDKFVFVKNTGDSDAYVRTFVALEQGSVAAADFKNVIMTNSDGTHWAYTSVSDVEIDGNKYCVMCFEYIGKSNGNGTLAAGAVSYPSLLQVYMKPEATNEDVEAIDGNDNGKYDILVLSQAVQTAGFDTASDALNEGFGEATSANLTEWFEALN